MKTILILASALFIGCARTPTATPIMAHAVPAHEVTSGQLPITKVAGNTSTTAKQADENPYDALIEEEAAAEIEQERAAKQAAEDQKLHELMVKAVWGDCAPGDPQCSVINEPEVKANQ